MLVEDQQFTTLSKDFVLCDRIENPKDVWVLQVGSGSGGDGCDYDKLAR